MSIKCHTSKVVTSSGPGVFRVLTEYGGKTYGALKLFINL